MSRYVSILKIVRNTSVSTRILPVPSRKLRSLLLVELYELKNVDFH